MSRRGKSIEAAYHACIWLRAAVRVLHHLSTQEMDPDGRGYDELYKVIRRTAPWQELLRPGMTLAVDVRMQSCSDWNHSAMAQQCIHAAVSDALRDAGCALSVHAK
jgi:23S rRNA G2445 N2-methylase RlmL